MSLKRACADEECVWTPHPTPHPTYSFNDGSTILNAKPTSFPVHRTMLCTHSIIFATTFSMPQISPWDERDDCLVDMPDSPKYFVCLLKAFYKPLSIFAWCGMSKSQGCRRCVRNFATEHQVRHARYSQKVDRTTSVLFPANLVEFEERATTYLCVGDVLRATRRETEVHWILPAALY